MEKLSRTIASAHQLAHANGIESDSNLSQLIGEMTRKLNDGLIDSDIYEHGRSIAKKLAHKESMEKTIDQLIARVKTSGNPLTSSYQAG